MNTHKNARLTFARRLEMVRSIVEQQLTPALAAAEAGVSLPTARKWLGRFLSQGQTGLADRSSRPKLSPRAIGSNTALAIVELRHRRLTQARIAQALGVSKSTIFRAIQSGRMSAARTDDGSGNFNELSYLFTDANGRPDGDLAAVTHRNRSGS